FPRETAETASSTRELLKTVNDGLPYPVSLLYVLTPFQMLDFASIAQDKELQAEEHHFMNYKTAGMSPDEIARECSQTLIEVSKNPHAPVCDIVLYKTPDSLNGVEIAKHPGRNEIHGWLKAIERGMGVFLERELHGRDPDMNALREVRSRILS